ncbi:SPW repeat domain-containing protein [Salinarimonas rosea]|uniref:SPW repeat domain-containing protein n=1 Tax=Salinarimonas rosea TaxID=552063 RepID=UPI00041C3B28|nr:SPW repeat protein [Salinarimonas rosea]
MIVRWTNERTAMDWVLAALGLGLAASPWLYDFEEEILALASATALGLGACASLALPRAETRTWVAFAAGGLAAAAPWLLGFADVRNAAGMHVALGVGLAALAVLRAAFDDDVIRERRARAGTEAKRHEGAARTPPAARTERRRDAPRPSRAAGRTLRADEAVHRRSA